MVQPAAPHMRMLLLSAVCLLLLQGALCYTATTPTKPVNPSKSETGPFSSWPGNYRTVIDDYANNDVVFFMQNITFPSNPTWGTLLEIGGDKGLFVGITAEGHFLASAGKQGSPKLGSGPFPPSTGKAIVITDNFPKDDAMHDVLVYVTVGSNSVEGSIRVFIDCEEVGVGFTLYGPLFSASNAGWADSDNGAYLLKPKSGTNYNKQVSRDPKEYNAQNKEIKDRVPAWPGGAAGAGPLNIYYKDDADAAPLFENFTPAFFGCAACSAAATAQCDVNLASAKCSDGNPVECTCNFPFVVGDGAPGDCKRPFFTAKTDTDTVRPGVTNYQQPASSISMRRLSVDRSKDIIFYMQGITFPSVPTAGCLFHLGGNRGLWVGINSQNEFEVYVRSSVSPRFKSDNFPKDGEKHAVLVYVKTGVEEERGAVRVFIDCKEIREPKTFMALTGSWADGDSGSYLLESSSGTPNGNKQAWPGGAEGAGPLNIYSAVTEPALFDPFTPYYFGCGESCNGPETASCDPNADCARGNFTDVSELVGPEIWPEITCTCRTGWEGPGETCTDINECVIEAKTNECHYLAECDNSPGSFACVCPTGFVGEGEDACYGDSWSVRTVFEVPGLAADRRALTTEQIEAIKLEYARIIADDAALPANASQVSGMPVSFGAFRYGESILEILQEDAEGQLTLMALMLDKDEAELTVGRLNNPNVTIDWSNIGTLVDVPNVYRWVAQTTSAGLEINPSGLQVDSVYFEPTCLSSGCWKVHITYTAGTDSINVIYIPKAVGDDSASYDFDYSVDDATWKDMSPEDTFVASRHPCSGTLDYDPTSGVLPASVTSCCIPQFTEMYRPVSSFVAALDAVAGLRAVLDSACAPAATGGNRNRAVDSATVPILAKRGQALNLTQYVFPRPQAPAVAGLGADIFSDGAFEGMAESRINHTQVVDAYIGVYRAVLSLDEVEVRGLAGQLRGTVGVEHTVDTFVGKASFSMTGIPFLDPFATQVAIHLEKTNFFSVSTHGVNAYTFLEYVNMRLVSVLKEDRDFSGVSTGTGASGDANGDDEASSRTVRTNTTGNVNYVQVTFTLGNKYGVNNNPNDDQYESGLIPLSSVRVGRGTFLELTPLEHVCKEYAEAAAAEDAAQLVGLSAGRVAKGTFDHTAAQPCGPQASMCASPRAIPDQFVSFNIPLGSEILDGEAARDLSNNIFVDLVVNALDTEATGTPNNGADPQQMKTRLTASIPIVAGGVNIFCDGVTAKTDLKDVADAAIVVGTAAGAAELTRLRIIEGVASTDLAAVNSTQIDTDSIESALMTLVLRGSESYFASGAAQTGGYSLELDDLITLHMMEDGDAGSVVDGVASNSKEAAVLALLKEAADDNSEANGLDTDGYKLNGAFRFDVARADGIAKLEPTAELLAVCPFNPPRPAAGNAELESCITRRDVRSRTYPAPTGSPFPTAIEIFNSGVMSGGVVSSFVAATEEAAIAAQVATAAAAPCPGGGGVAKAAFADAAYACEAGFMASVLGDSEYARQLAKDFVAAIRTRYDLNGRYTRAFWINPGYEWTPTQAAGKSLFQVSQKVYLFALITLDENWSRRRMLLQADPTAASGSGAAGAKLEVAVTRRLMLATSFDVPEDKVAVFWVEVQLTRGEACASRSELQRRLRDTMHDYLSTTASPFHTAQITRLSVDMRDEQCGTRPARRSLLTEWSSATAKVELMVVFAKGTDATFNEKAFTDMAGVNAIAAANNNRVTMDDTFRCEDCTPSAAKPHSSSHSSDNTALIAGVCGGVGGAVLVGAGVMLWVRSKEEEAVMAPAVQSIDVSQLKAQLQEEV